MEEKPHGLARELVPHAAWRGIELLWDFARATIVAILVLSYQWFVHHWDIVTIAIAFLGCLGLLIWKDLSGGRGRATTQGMLQLDASLQSKYEAEMKASAHHEARADMFKTRMEAEQDENDRLTKALAECQLRVDSPTNIQVVHTAVEEDPAANYPLKIRYQMKNMSTKCADVTLQGYQLNNPVMLRQLLFEVLQSKHNAQWDPRPDGTARLAILPNQEFRGWIAVNDAIFKKDQVDKLIGNLGVVLLFIDGVLVKIDI